MTAPTARRRRLLVGGGGHASSLLQFAAGMADGYTDLHPDASLPCPCLGSDSDFLASADPEEWEVNVTVVGGSGCDMSLRRAIIGRFAAAGFPFFTLTAPTAIVTPGSAVGPGCSVMHRAVVNGASVGAHCVINTGAIVEHACRLADNVFVGPGAVICGGVTVGADTFIGAGATVRNDVSICAGAVIGIGAAVVADITLPGVYAGVPAKLIKPCPDSTQS